MRTATVTLVLAAVAGLALRIWTLTSPLGPLDVDEAIWGLMSLHVVDGEIPTFFWGQEYGGSQETLLTSGVVALVGPSAAAIRVVPIALFAAAVWLVRLIGRETVGEPAATYAAAIACVWPAYAIWKSTRAHGFYGSGIVLALLAVLLVLKLRRRDSQPLSAALGLVLGLGLWATPQVGLLGLPALGWLVASRPRVLRGVPIAALGAVLGALPWLLWNIGHDWASFGRAVESDVGRYDNRLRGFATALMPTVLGLRVPFSHEWLPGPLLGWGLYLALLAGFLWLALFRRRGVGLLLVIAVSYPFLFALSPYAWYIEEPRYLVLLVPVLALLAAPFIATSRFAPIAVAALAAISAAGLTRMADAHVLTADGLPLPPDRAPLIRALDNAGTRHVVADYDLAYVLTFETDERIVAAPDGEPRYPPHSEEVLADPRRAYVAVAGSDRDRAWRDQFTSRRRVAAGGFAAYVVAHG